MSTISAPTRTRTGRRSPGPIALGVAGVLFALYPIARPWTDVTEAGSPAAFASPAWIVAHLSAVAGFVLVAFALLALRDILTSTPGARLANAALGTWWIGAGLVLPYYGAEVFALHAIGERIQQTGDMSLMGLVEAVRMGGTQVTAFGGGLLLLGVAAVLAAVAAARSGVMSRFGGLLFAAGFALYLPQFYGTPWMRIAHGVLVGIGCLVLALQLRRASS